MPLAALSRLLFIRYRGIKDNGLEQFRRAETYVVLHPDAYRSATSAIPYDQLR